MTLARAANEPTLPDLTHGYALLQGDCLDTMRQLPDACVQTCVTSPPYYGLRSYLGTDDADKHLEIGLEDSPEAYVAKLVEVFREVRRVLRDDGTVFLNLGDSYWGGKGKSGYELPHEAEARRGLGETMQHAHNVPGYQDMRPTDGKHPVIKPKDLIGIPWLVAFALRADGWWLRSDIIWAKTAPMPESVTDRCTKAHEYLFLLTKNANYYYDADAIREPLKPPSLARWNGEIKSSTQSRNNASVSPQGINTIHKIKSGDILNPDGRNKRSVWWLGPESFNGAHFAVMPTKLVEPCILAGTSAYGACAKCGAPWARVAERTIESNWQERKQGGADSGSLHNGHNASHGRGVTHNLPSRDNVTLGWQPTCNCNADVVPCVVLDPFSGAATSGLVALKHHRRYIGCELNAAYIEMSHKRLLAVAAQPLLFPAEVLT